MTPAFDANGVQIYLGDCREVLRELPSESVHCCVTSPPYWGLRDYGTSSWEGGSADCDHAPRPQIQGTSTARNGDSLRDKPSSECKCGATRIDRQIGLEDSPVKYIATMREVFAEVRRVLRSDGTAWINMGDSYNAHPGQRTVHDKAGYKQTTNRGSCEAASRSTPELKAKDLVGIPWMLAFALREDGWYLRQDIIWAKPNPMPESVTDRCTKSHEYIFLLSKSERYYYNQEAILEAVSPNTHARLSQDVQSQIGSERVPGKTNGNMKAVARTPSSYKGSIPGRDGGPGQDRRSENDRGRKSLPETQANLGAYRDTQRKLAAAGSGIKNNESLDATMALMPEKRNRRSVWEVTTQPFPEAHFATFPQELIKPCILAGCPEGGTVLDPFIGSGTTGMVARSLHSKAIGIELNPAYIEIAAKRLQQEVFAFSAGWGSE